jgi:SAM-dependent methyltransferase
VSVEAIKQAPRSRPEDYWQDESFVRRYVSNAVVTTNDNVGTRLFHGVCLSAIAQGIAYICAKPSNLLYAGCGHSIKGSVMQKHFGCPVVGIDSSPLMLEASRKLQFNYPPEHRTETRLMDVNAIEFPDDSFDAVFCYGLLMSLPSPERAIAEMLRVSRRGLVAIEESDRVMDEDQYAYWLEVKNKRYPGRVYWHDYIRQFRRCMQIVVTPMPVPPQWDMGKPPGYVRLIAVKAMEVGDASIQ